jgi:hypothetical protein
MHGPSGAHGHHDADAVQACRLLDRAMAMRRAWQEKLVVIDPDECTATSLDDSSRSSTPHGSPPLSTPNSTPPSAGSSVSSPSGSTLSTSPLRRQRSSSDFLRRQAPEFSPFTTTTCPPLSEHEMSPRLNSRRQRSSSASLVVTRWRNNRPSAPGPSATTAPLLNFSRLVILKHRLLGMGSSARVYEGRWCVTRFANCDYAFACYLPLMSSLCVCL